MFLNQDICYLNITYIRFLLSQADCYSLGVVLWELVTGETPVRGSMRAVRVPEECLAAAAALIEQCMAAAPAERPDANQICEPLHQLAGGYP